MAYKTRREFLKAIGGVIASGGMTPVLSRAAAGGTRHDFSSGRPNILLFFPDQHRYDWLGTTPGLPVRTPNLDALTRRGVQFRWAFTPSPLCAPARACLASGKEYDRCRVADNKVDYPLDQVTFYSLLRESGYHVAGCGKFDLHKATLDWGLDGKYLIHDWGFSDGIDSAGKWAAVKSGADEPKDPYMAYLHSRGLARLHVEDFSQRRKIGAYKATFPTPLSEDAYCDNWVAQNGLKLMKKFPKGRPWFLQVNFPGPHPPMDITKRMDSICRGRNFPPPNRNTQLDYDIHNSIRQNYSAMVENIDRWVGIYIDELRKRGELANTLIVYSSDHGEMLGDHNMWGKQKPYQPSVGVPLIIAGPGVVQRGETDTPVSVMDLCATFLDYADLPIPSGMDSKSLKPFLSGEKNSHRKFVFSGLGSWRIVFNGRYKLITGYAKNGEPILYDLLEDPFEKKNIAPQAETIVESLLKIFNKQLRSRRS